MIRTQIYIPETLHTQVKLFARNQKKSLAEVLREFIKQGMVGKKNSGVKTLQSLIDLKITGGPKDLSKNLDKYLYQK